MTITPPLCTKCGQPNVRGRRTRVCAACLPTSKGALDRERSDRRKAECPPDKRWCGLCDEFLPPAQFGTRDNGCLVCISKRGRTNSRMRNYGITDEQYEALLAAQGGTCAICKNAPKKQALHVDHNHKTGVIRGLLCLWCNHRLLGGARESTEILERAALYLTYPPALEVIGEMIAPGKPRRAKQKSAA